MKLRIAKSQESACSRARSAAVVLQRDSSTLANATSAAEQCGYAIKKIVSISKED